MIVVAGLGVRVVIDGLHLPLGILECHLFVLLLLKIQFLFALPLAGRCTFLVQLLLLFVELFYKLLDLPSLTRVVMCGVVHHASRATIVATRCLMGELLVTSWA
jgi:hypothetical protein